MVLLAVIHLRQMFNDWSSTQDDNTPVYLRWLILKVINVG